MSKAIRIAVLAGTAVFAACDGTSDNFGSNPAPGGPEVPETYSFESNFVAGESSVSYQGQICRHVLITALTNAVRDAAEISGQEYRGESVPYLDDTIAGALAEQETAQILGLELPVPEDVATLGDLCGSKHLVEKLAGNDTVTDHDDWNNNFRGVDGFSSAEVYARSLIEEASERAERGTSAPNAPSYVTPDGRDLAQLVQKFLLGAVALSQGMDDYLDDDVDGKGLLASAEQDGDAPYSSLEHQWDEGYGYFGAARAYGARSDEVNRTGVVDDNEDGVLDINAEHNFGASTNAAKRDVGASPEAPTDFTGDAFEALKTGRAIITQAGVRFSEMSTEQRQALLAARDAAVQAWEAAYAATVVHYINDTLDDLSAIDDPQSEFSFADLAKHFSEMKGFALGFQFHRNSPLLQPLEGGSGQSRFERLHELLRDNPPCEAGVCVNEQAYRDDLLEARALMGDAYGFAQENLEVW
jgi:hypothetical protein